MTGSHSCLGISDWESRTTGVIQAYDTGYLSGNVSVYVEASGVWGHAPSGKFF